MEIAGGILGWTENQFWDCSYQYFQASVDGWLERNGKRESVLAEDDYEDFKQENAAYLAMSGDDLKRLREKRENDEIVS